MMMSRNPYRDGRKKPRLKPSVFVFMDILGYREMTIAASTSGSQQLSLETLHEALTTGRKWLEEKNLPKEFKKLGEKDFYAFKGFTDNVVLGWPIADDAELELGSAFGKVAEFQFSMALHGFFVRGAISVGNAYIDDTAVIGDALIEAYEGEIHLARDPRVILTRSAVDAVKRHLDYYTIRARAPQARDLLQDSDGQWFVNYLDEVMLAADDSGPFFEEFMQHRDRVEEQLLKHRENPPIFSKYAWVAGYHNFFCDLHSSYFTDEHRIDTNLFKTPPKLIVNDA